VILSQFMFLGWLVSTFTTWIFSVLVPEEV